MQLGDPLGIKWKGGPTRAMNRHRSQAGINIDTPLRFQDELPDATDLIVIGGGIVGIFSALYANRLGLKVLVLEKGRIACEQSSRNWGWCRQQGRDAAELPIVMEANRLWGEVDAELRGKTGFARGGCLYLARGEERLAKFSEWMEIAKAHQLDTRLLSSREVTDKIDHRVGGASSNSPWVGGIWTPSDARAEPWVAVPSVAGLARSEGVAIVENCAVRSLDIQGGQVAGVVTEWANVRADQVMLAGGAWSSLLLQHHGVFIPQLSVRATVVRTDVLPNFFDGTAIDEGLAIRRREDGGYTLADRDPVDLYLGRDAFRAARYYLPTLKSSLANPRIHPIGPKEFPDSWLTPRRWQADEESPFERTRVLDPIPNSNSVESAADQFAKLFPGLGVPKILNTWAGMVDTMPDIVPVIDRVPELDGLILATGMSGHGFGMGPGVGKIVADLALQRHPGHSLNRFRYSRFSDGSKLDVGPAV